MFEPLREKAGVVAVSSLAVLLVSCGPSHRNLREDASTTATLRSSGENLGFYTSRSYTVKKIDGKTVSYMTSWKAEDKKIVVAAGKHSVELGGTYELGFGMPSGFALPNTTMVEFLPGNSYITRGRFNYPRMSVWIENTGTGKPACPVMHLPCVPFSGGGYTPPPILPIYTR